MNIAEQNHRGAGQLPKPDCDVVIDRAGRLQPLLLQKLPDLSTLNHGESSVRDETVGHQLGYGKADAPFLKLGIAIELKDRQGNFWLDALGEIVFDQGIGK